MLISYYKYIGESEKQLFFPCIALHLGDGPAQKEVCGIYKGNCNFGCTICEHNTLSNELYKSSQTRDRDFDSIKMLCKVADDAIHKRNRELQPNEKNAQEKLQLKSIYPYYNSFFDAPMGINSNIFTCTPPDILHTICAGIMKNLLLWILGIICKFSSDNKKYSNSASKVDSRFASIFRLPDNIPHVYWDFFPDGIIRFMSSKQDKKSKEQTTGSFSGFKSSSFIGILLQLHFVIGWNGDILPNTKIYMHGDQINLGNINNKIQFAILSILDVYFQLKMHPISQTNIDTLNTTIQSMQAHVLSVWFIKQSILNANRMHHKSINMHKVIHMPYYTYYGSYVKLDTASFESSHKILTKGIYLKTSRQTNTLQQEMLIKSIEHGIHEQYLFIENALTLEIEDHLKLFNLPNLVENISFNVIANLKYYKLQFTQNHKQFILTDNKDNKIDDPTTILNHSSHTVANMLSVLDQIFITMDIDEIINELNNNNIIITIRKGVKYQANAESGMGTGHLYATSKLGKSKLRPRYDYILVNVSETKTLKNDKNEEYIDIKNFVQPAQLLGILEVKQILNNEIDTQIHYMIQYLTESKTTTNQGYKSPFKLYTWEYEEGGNRTINPKYNIDVITHDAINGQAYIFPYFNGGYCPINHFTTTDDLFWLVDRKYFDRSGWEDYTESIINTNTGILLNQVEMQQIEKQSKIPPTTTTSNTNPHTSSTNNTKLPNTNKRKHASIRKLSQQQGITVNKQKASSSTTAKSNLIANKNEEEDEGGASSEAASISSNSNSLTAEDSSSDEEEEEDEDEY